MKDFGAKKLKARFQTSAFQQSEKACAKARKKRKNTFITVIRNIELKFSL